jgi:lipoprotein
MKSLFNIYGRLLLGAVMTALCALLCGCTRNNGDIGPWFGTWHLTSVEINGEDETGYMGNIFWAFQNNIIQLTLVPVDEEGNHEQIRRFGTWAEENGTLLVCFEYNDDTDPAGWEYRPFEELHIPYKGVTSLAVIKKPGSETVLRYTADDGAVYTYKLKKQG